MYIILSNMNFVCTRTNLNFKFLYQIEKCNFQPRFGLCSITDVYANIDSVRTEKFLWISMSCEPTKVSGALALILNSWNRAETRHIWQHTFLNFCQLIFLSFQFLIQAASKNNYSTIWTTRLSTWNFFLLPFYTSNKLFLSKFIGSGLGT